MKFLHYICIGFSSLVVLAGCGAAKSIPNTFSTQLPNTITYSVQFESLWYDLGQETATLKSLSRYQPSDKLISQYNLQRLGDKAKTVVATGYLRIEPTVFDAQQVVAFGGQITPLSEDVVSFICPIVRLSELLKVAGITNIELPTRIIIRR